MRKYWYDLPYQYRLRQKNKAIRQACKEFDREKAALDPAGADYILLLVSVSLFFKVRIEGIARQPVYRTGKKPRGQAITINQGVLKSNINYSEAVEAGGVKLNIDGKDIFKRGSNG